MTLLLLVRHAHAGDRESWTGPDDLRPLSEKGRRQAMGLVDLLQPYSMDLVTSSPSLRCTQTVEPLAAAHGLSVLIDERLLEGHDPEDTARWLEAELARRSLAACTHGDIVPALLNVLDASGAQLPDRLQWSKASTWVLERDHGAWVRGTYLPPPG